MTHHNHRPASSAWPSNAYHNMYDDGQDNNHPRQPYEDQHPMHLTRSHYHHHHPSSRTGKDDDVERSSPRADAYAERRGRQDPNREQTRKYTEEEYDYRSTNTRSRSRSPRGAPPNSTVILDGTMDLTQEDLSKGWAILVVLVVLQIINELQKRLLVNGIQDIRLIKDRRTGQSRQFAFAQFVGIPEATRFLNKYYPVLHLYGAYDPAESGNLESIQVRVAYSREKEERERNGKGDDDWKCDVCYVSNFPHRNLCFRCNAPHTRSTANGIVVKAGSSNSGLLTTGESDASPNGMASQFILVRGLEPGANEELLAKGVCKLYKMKPALEPTEPRTKKYKISSTTDDASFGAKEGSLRRVLLMRDRKSGDSWRYGFAEFNTVEDAQAAMTKFRSLEKFTISSKPVTISYIHAGVFVPVLQAIDEELTKFTFSPLSNTAARLMYWDESAYASEFVVASADQSKLSSKKNETEHARLAAAAQNEGLVAAGKDGGPKAKKRKVEKDSKAVAPRLQFWTNQHAELHGKSAIEATRAGTTSSISNLETSEVSVTTYADLKRRCCLLCSRQFKTELELDKHTRLSQLHHDNLKDKELVSMVEMKMTKSINLNLDTSTYRDRARERRSAFNQPRQPSAQHKRPSKDKTSEEEISAPVQSKGAALLGKMGWSVGEGLGATGSGRKEAITTHLYSQGVGLGATGGKIGEAVEEAQRQTKGSYSDFVNKSKEMAKARFESLG